MPKEVEPVLKQILERLEKIDRKIDLLEGTIKNLPKSEKVIERTYYHENYQTPKRPFIHPDIGRGGLRSQK